MKLVVGLGNPGLRYRDTRHNVGFRVIEELAKRYAASKPTLQAEAEVADIRIGSEKLLLACPQTFMNLSGRSVRQLVDFYRVELADMLVVCDDMNLESGRLRVRKSGSAGGQKGLADILLRMGNIEDVPRLRIGIGRPPGKMVATDYVLSRFRSEEIDDVEVAIVRAADAVEAWVREGIGPAMTRFNAKSDDGGNGGESSSD